MKKIQFRKFIFTSVISSAMIVGCTHDYDNNTDINSPALRLAESEKLSIPPAIDLPSNEPNGNTRVATFYAEGVQKYKAKLIAGFHCLAAIKIYLQHFFTGNIVMKLVLQSSNYFSCFSLEIT